jgi:hypothetical protein
MQWSTWSDISVANVTGGTGVKLFAPNTVVNAANAELNTFWRLRIRNTGIALTMDSGPGGINDCFANTFVGLDITYSGASGLNLVNGDNNTFFDTLIFRTAGVGPGVNLCIGKTKTHFQSRSGAASSIAVVQ